MYIHIYNTVQYFIVFYLKYYNSNVKNPDI